MLPLAMYVFQIVGVIKQNKSVDELEIYYILPIMMVLVPAVYLIRAKLFDKIRGDDPKEFEKELSRGKLSFWEQMKDLFH